MEDRATLEGPKQPKRNKQAKKQANKQQQQTGDLKPVIGFPYYLNTQGSLEWDLI